MVYLKTDDENILVEFDAEKKRAQVVDKLALKEQVLTAEQRLAEIPDAPTDKEFLAWAKDNYPFTDYSVEKATLEAIIAKSIEVEAVK